MKSPEPWYICKAVEKGSAATIRDAGGNIVAVFPSADNAEYVISLLIAKSADKQKNLTELLTK